MPAFAPKRILVQIDADHPSPEVLDRCFDLAKLYGGNVTIVDVVPESPWPMRIMTAGIERAIEQITHEKSDKLQAIASQLSGRGIPAASRVLEAPSSVAIIREVLREKHDLVVRNAKGRASRQTGFFGTTAKRLLRKCPCPVLLLRSDHPGRWTHLVAAVDTTTTDEIHAELNTRIVDAALSLTQDPRNVEVLCAWALYGEQVLKGHMRDDEFDLLVLQAKAASERRLDDLVNQSDVKLPPENARLLHGDAGEVIPRFVSERQTDLLVMGTIGRSGAAGLLIGNTAERILYKVECDVLAIKPAGFVCPVRV